MTKQGTNDGSVTKLRCVVERITYQNAENGYSVMKVKVKGYNDLVTGVQTCALPILNGRWTNATDNSFNARLGRR